MTNEAAYGLSVFPSLFHRFESSRRKEVVRDSSSPLSGPTAQVGGVDGEGITRAGSEASSTE